MSWSSFTDNYFKSLTKDKTKPYRNVLIQFCTTFWVFQGILTTFAEDDLCVRVAVSWSAHILLI